MPKRIKDIPDYKVEQDLLWNNISIAQIAKKYKTTSTIIKKIIKNLIAEKQSEISDLDDEVAQLKDL